MASQKHNDVVQYLKYMLSEDYVQETGKFNIEIGTERYNLVVEYLASIGLLELLKFQSGKYRVLLKNSLDKNFIQDLIEKLEKQEIIL